MLIFQCVGSSTSHSGSASTVVGQETSASNNAAQPANATSPRRSLSLSPADALASGWKRPWMSQVNTPSLICDTTLTVGDGRGAIYTDISHTSFALRNFLT